MALDVQSLTWNFAAPSAGAAQGDPNASLGGYWSSTKLEDVESTVTSATNGMQFIDTTQIGQAHAGKVLLFVDGQNKRQAMEIDSFNTGTGEFVCLMAGGFTNTPGTGDRYRIYESNGLFSTFTSTMGQANQAIHRLVFARNQTGSHNLTEPRVYVTPVLPGPFALDICYGANYTGNPDVDDIAVQTDEPVIDGSSGQFTHTSRPQTWRSEWSYPSAMWTPNVHATSSSWHLDQNWNRPLWLKLRIYDEDVIPATMEKAIFVVTLESIETGGNPDPIETSFAVVVNFEITEAVSVAADRKPRTFGGCRVDVTVTDAVTGVPIPDRVVVMSLVAPSPGALNQPYEEVTDGDGYIGAVYLSPEDEGEVGSQVTFKAETN